MIELNDYIEFRLSSPKFKKEVLHNLTNLKGATTLEVLKKMKLDSNVIEFELCKDEIDYDLVVTINDLEGGLLLNLKVFKNLKEIKETKSEFVLKRASKNSGKVSVTRDEILSSSYINDFLSEFKKVQKSISKSTPKTAPQLIKYLDDNLSETAKLAISSELEKVIQKKDLLTTVRWFKRHGFSNIPDDIHLMTRLGDYEFFKDKKGKLKYKIGIDWEQKTFYEYTE